MKKKNMFGMKKKTKMWKKRESKTQKTIVLAIAIAILIFIFIFAGYNDYCARATYASGKAVYSASSSYSGAQTADGGGDTVPFHPRGHHARPRDRWVVVTTEYAFNIRADIPSIKSKRAAKKII